MARPARIVVIGGGFAGIACARTLRHLLPPRRAEVVLFDRQNHAVFHPLLAEVAAGALRPADVGASLRQLLRGVQCRTEPVLGIDFDARTLDFEGDDGSRARLGYDHVVIAAGGSVDLSIVPGMAEHGLPLKTIGDALAIQAHVMDRLERAEVCADPARKSDHLSFVVVGGGFSGVELAGEIHDLVLGSLRFFPSIQPHECRVTLVHSRGEILPEVSPSLRRFARTRMERRGIRFVLGHPVVACTAAGVALANGTFVRAQTVACTIGSKPTALLQSLAVAKANGRLRVDPDLALVGRRDAWAIGDCALVVNAHDGAASPATGQFAERQGRQAAHNIAACLTGQPTRPFSHRSLGTLCSIGGHQAVAELGGVRMAGRLAWLVWRGVYLCKLPSWAQRLRAGLGLLCDTLLPRPLAYSRVDATRRVARAFHRAGDFVFRRGDAAGAFYVIEKGEVEIVAGNGVDGTGEVVAVLGPGDFFGESALQDARRRERSARARTDLEVLAFGGGVFHELSTAFAPVRAALAAAKRRRTPVWDRLAPGKRILGELGIAPFVESTPAALLRPGDSLVAAVVCMDHHRLDACHVVDDRGCLVGLLTRSDLLRAIDVVASRDEAERPSIRVGEVMVSDPVALRADDSALVAVAAMREHGWKQMPVVAADGSRRLLGQVRLERLLVAAMQQRGVTSDVTGPVAAAAAFAVTAATDLATGA